MCMCDVMGMFGPFLSDGICCDTISADSTCFYLMGRDDRGLPILIMHET